LAASVVVGDAARVDAGVVGSLAASVVIRDAARVAAGVVYRSWRWAAAGSAVVGGPHVAEVVGVGGWVVTRCSRIC
jgi:hypothetical protein